MPLVRWVSCWTSAAACEIHSAPPRVVTQAFFRTANPEDEFLLLTVSTQPAVIPGFMNDVATLEKAIELTKPGGRTALIDTVYLGLSRMRAARRPRRALLILSDGMDNQSRYSKSDLMRIALEADVQIYTILIDNGSASATDLTVPFRPTLIKKPIDQAQDRQGVDLLEALSARTVGLHFRAHNDDEAKEAVTKAVQALRKRVPDRISAPRFWNSRKMAPGSCQIECAEGEYSRAQRLLLALRAFCSKSGSLAANSCASSTSSRCAVHMNLWRLLLNYIVTKHESYLSHGSWLVCVRTIGAEDGPPRVIDRMNPGKISPNEKPSVLKSGRHSD